MAATDGIELADAMRRHSTNVVQLLPDCHSGRRIAYKCLNSRGGHILTVLALRTEHVGWEIPLIVYQGRRTITNAQAELLHRLLAELDAADREDK